MPDPNGADNTQQPSEQLEQINKLLLRAEVLQKDALEILQKAVGRHDASVAEHDAWIAEARKRDQVTDERIQALVRAIADLISRVPPENPRGGVRA